MKAMFRMLGDKVHYGSELDRSEFNSDSERTDNRKCLSSRVNVCLILLSLSL